MKNTICKFTRITAAIVMGVALNHAQPAMAGWKGAMNGTGFGQATVNVVSVEEVSKTVTTPNVQDPSVAMTITTGYTYGATLPSKSSPATVAKVIGRPGYVWEKTTIGSNGDSTDNPELESRINIIAADCASLEMKSSSILAQDEKSGTITVKAKATAGTALWLRGIEYTGNPGDLPEDNEATDENETIEFLKANGALKWDILLAGPFDLQTADCDSIKIPFTIETDPSHLYFISDGVAKSLPLAIECPKDIEVFDTESVKYPETVQVGGCGIITVTFDPAAPAGGSFAPGSFPVGSTPVTVTATDKDGNTKTCTFNVVVKDTTAPVITASGTPENGVLGLNPTAADIEAALGKATATDNGGDVTPNAETGSVSENGCSRSQTRTWTATDAAGNQATSVSRTATWTEDTTPPVIPVLPALTGACGASVTLTAPTTTDNCAGTVTGTTTTVFPITAAGTTVVTWTFNDGNGNSSTATQTVVVTSLTFQGFYSPVGTVNNTIATPVIRNAGSSFPLKWDMLCGTTPLTGGTPPTVDIQKVSPQVGPSTKLTAEYQNDWHINWPTPNTKKNDIYKATVNLPDGSQAVLFVQFK